MSTDLPPIVVINLARSKTRLRATLEMFTSLGVTFERFDAFEGRALKPTELKLYSGSYAKKLAGRELTAGEIACALSHIRVWQSFLNSDEEELLVLEDDAVVGVGLLSLLRNRSRFPDDWQFINFRSDADYVPSTDVIADIYQLTRFTARPNGCVAYLINRSGATFLLGDVFPIRRAIDGHTGNLAQTGMKTYGVYPGTVNLRNVASTIEGREDAGRVTQIKRYRRVLRKLVSVVANRRLK